MFSMLVLNAAGASQQFYTYNVTTHPSVLHVPIGDQIGNISYWSKTNIQSDNKTWQCNPTDPGFCFFTYSIEVPWINRNIAADSRYENVIQVKQDLYNYATKCNSNKKLEPQAGGQTGKCAAYYKPYSDKSCNLPEGLSANDAYKKMQEKSSPTARLYPDCYKLVSEYGCLTHHPNFKYMTTIAKVADKTHPSGNSVVHYEEVNLNVRVCKTFADQLYDKCRYAGSIEGDKVAYNNRWIVDPGMGKDDFYKKLRIFWFNQSDPEQKDYPGVNCWSPSPSDQKDIKDL